MYSSLGEMDRNGEELAGRKKSRFKQLKTRLFGKLKKKESEGLMKQSQSASDITAPGGGRESYDSEDECLFPQCLSSRALSHDSIFFTDQAQSTEPTRVLSQENVHGKIKALQLKLQQQNLRLGPPPMLIPRRRTEDSGATSEDDGLPCSPPEMSFHEQVMHGAVYKYPESQKHLSSLSLSGTGSEEEEQPSSRPLSPVSKPPPQPIICPTSALTTPSTGVDISSPVHCTPRLDNSAARHRMSVKPRNQRVSTRGKRAPMVSLSSRHRSESVNDLDNILSEEDDDETVTTTETMRQRLYSSPTFKLREKPTSPEPKAATPALSGQSQEETPTEIYLLSKDVEILKSEESNEPEGRVTTNPLYLQPIATGLSSGRASPSGLPESTQTSRETEPFRTHSPNQRHPDTRKIQISDRKGFQGSSENLRWETGGIQPEASFRLHPVPHMRKPKMEIRNPPSPKGATEASTKPWEVGLEPSTPEISPTAACKGVAGSPSGKDGDTKSQTLNSASFQFSIASAKYRSKTPSETVAKQNEGNSKGAPGIKTQSNKPIAEPQKDEAREMKPTELQNHLSHQTQETKNSSRREVISPIMSKPTVNHPRKTETSVEQVETEKDEEPEDRKNAFGVQLRTTSLSLKYRSEVSKIKDETKRYSLESNQTLSVSEEHAWKAETSRNVCDGNSKSKASVPKKQDSQNLDSHCVATDNGRPTTQDTTNKEAGSEPGWMSLAREKTRAYQPLLSKLSTNQSAQVHPSPPAVPPLQPPKPTSQPPKPTSQPKTQKTQLTLNTANQATTQLSSQLTTQRSPSKLTPNGSKDKPVSPGWRVENPFSQSAGGGRIADSKDKGMPAVRNTTLETDATKKATVPSKEVNTRQESITPISTEAPTVTCEPSPASSSSLEVSHPLQPRSDGAEPSWMELAKRKSLAWSDKTLE